ncbi:hypothetical protein FIV37_11565 [Pseudomonas gessardii]|nr:hypothetical protein [Pseudomonas gessardii]
MAGAFDALIETQQKAPALIEYRGFLLAMHTYCDPVHVGAGLARDAGGAVIQLDRVDAIAGKPAPT